jgi:hypothetical protein
VRRDVVAFDGLLVIAGGKDAARCISHNEESVQCPFGIARRDRIGNKPVGKDKQYGCDTYPN